MKRRVAAGVVLLVLAALSLTFCKLDLPSGSGEPYLHITADVVYLTPDSVSIEFSYSAEDDRHLCRYSLSKKSGTVYDLVSPDVEEWFNAHQTYSLVLSGLPGDGAYRFSFSVLAERNGTYEPLQFLQQNVDFWVDTEVPAAPVLSEASGARSAVFELAISHSEIPSPTGSPVVIHYTIGSIAAPPADPTAADPVYDSPIPVDRNSIIKAVAVDKADNASPVASATYTFLRIDAISPTACPIDSSYHFFDVDGYFGVLFSPGGVYEPGSARVLLSQGAATPVECVIVDVASTEANLYIQIDGRELGGMAPGSATISVERLSPHDAVAFPFSLN